MSIPVPAPDWLAAHVARMVGDDAPIDPAEDLTAYGLDSMAVMRLAMELEERGIAVAFDDLLAEPTLAGWARLIAARAA